MQELTDTQNECDDRCLPIDRVGVKGLRFPVEVRDKGGSVQRTVATVSLAVDLPAHFKGTHMSRFLEVLNEHHGEVTMRTLPTILKRMPAPDPAPPLAHGRGHTWPITNTWSLRGRTSPRNRPKLSMTR